MRCHPQTNWAEAAWMWSHSRIMHQQLLNLPSPLFFFAIPLLSLSLLFSLSLVHQWCTRLTFRSLQESLAGSLPGISQLLLSPGLHTPFLALFNQQQTSCFTPATQLLLLSLSIYSCVKGGSACASMCVCVCVRERERERERARESERGRVGERGDGKDANMCLCLGCSSPLTSTQTLNLASRDLLFFYVQVCVQGFLYTASASLHV